MKIKIIASLAICIILLAGCSNTDVSETTANNSENHSVEDNTVADSSDTIFTIYKISSDTFISLLQRNSFEMKYRQSILIIHRMAIVTLPMTIMLLKLLMIMLKFSATLLSGRIILIKTTRMKE